MQNVIKSLCWAASILALSYLAKEQGMSDNATMGIVLGMVGAATASLTSGKPCRIGRCA